MPNSSEFNEASFREAYAQYVDECRRNEEARAIQRARELERISMYAMPIETATSVRLTVSPSPLSEPTWGPYTYVSVPSSPSEYEEVRAYPTPGRVQPSENFRGRWVVEQTPQRRITALGNEF